MFRLMLVSVALVVAGSSSAQLIKKYQVGNSGCSVYMYCDPKEFEVSYSEDSSMIWTAECGQGDYTYGVINVQLKQPVSDLEDAQNLIVSYLDFLKGEFGIRSAVGYGKGNRLKDNPDTRGVIDYWEDESGNRWKVRGWTDGNFLAVLYVYSAKELQETKINLFLDGFVFRTRNTNVKM